MPTEHDAETLAALRAIAEQIAAAAPQGWRRAVLRGFATGGSGSGHHGFWYEPEPPGGTGELDLHEALCRVHELERAGDRLSIELVVRPNGRFEALTSESLRRPTRPDRTGFTYLLRPGELPAEPADFQPGPADPTQAGDPLQALELLDGYLARRAEILDRPERLPQPLEADEREFLEDRLPVPLPADLRALYGRINGDRRAGLLHGHEWLGLNKVVALSDPADRWWAVRDWERLLFRELRYDSRPAGAVRRAVDRPGWLPFAHDTGGAFLAVDMDPGPNGRPGQVIRVGMRQDDGPVYVADSVTSLLQRHVDALADYSYQYRGGELRLFMAAEPEPAEGRELRVEGDSARLRDIPPAVQRLVIANTDRVDLAPLRGAPSLLEVELIDCLAADLSALRGTPVEVLTAELDGIDLAPLAAHPTLRVLRLTTGRPVDLSPLRDCPRLYGLDLARAEIGDVAVLTELDGVRHLRLNERQWDTLRETASHPAGLAAAELSGSPALRDAAAWAETLVDEPDLRYTRSRYEPSAGPRTSLWRRLLRLRRP
ncbi:SMI1/KNR4 family protein [Saccharopolyspora sp. 5N102]|uniref:SMI1/KNR4 family protein n=1 Tax=Saccharopolyspora sp. 5N102 TaxID=3375155 RepID=UPI0037A00B22